MKITSEMINIISAEEESSLDFGSSIIKYEIPSLKFVSYIFSDENHRYYNRVKVLREILNWIEECNGIEEFPIWSDLSSKLLHECIESEWDMRFIDKENVYGHTEQSTEQLIKESSKWKAFDHTIDCGDQEDCMMQLYAGTMNCINWYGNKDFGSKPKYRNYNRFPMRATN